MMQVDNSINEIITAINIAIDPLSSHFDRNKANAFIEEVKNNVSNDYEKHLAISFNLLNFVYPDTANVNDVLFQIKIANIHNFGLQLMEVLVKYNWNNLSQVRKDDLKILCENIICKKKIPLTTLTHIYESKLLKDEFSRLLTEILKREWPQNWPNILDICLNEKKNELVIYCLLRLSEDLCIFFLPNNPQRRREMNAELNLKLNAIMEYFSTSLDLQDISLSILTLQALSSFFEWCSILPEALTFLCQMLTIEMSDTDTLLRVCNNVADCFFTCLNRKIYKGEEKKVLLILFETKNLSLLMNFFEKLLSFVQHKIDNKQIDEKTFDLVNRICNIFALMGQTCMTLFSPTLNPPETWPLYLNVMLKLFEYDNQIYNYYSLQFWKDFLKNQNLKINNFLSINQIETLILMVPNKMSKREQTSDMFLTYEFDGLDDYDTFFFKFKSELSIFLKTLTKTHGDICFKMAISLINNTLKKQEFVKQEWETIATVLDSVCKNLDPTESNIHDGLHVLNYLLSIENIENPDIMSIILSCISALTVFILDSSDLLKKILSKIFTLMNYFPQDNSPTSLKSKSLMSLRRHACTLFIKLAKEQSKTMFFLFKDIKIFVEGICNQQDIGITQVEKCFLYEGLLMISNDFHNYLDQKDFLNEILTPIEWLLQYNMSSVDFMKHIGLTSPIDQWNTYSLNRASLVYTVNIITVITRRVTRKNVLLPEILPYIVSLTKLISNLNEIWNPQNQQLCPFEFRDLIFSPILESDRNILLENQFGIISQKKKIEDTESPQYFAQRMQVFLWLLHENCFTAIGQSTMHLNPEIYNNMDFTSILPSFEHLPDFKLKIIARVLIKPLLINCPNSKEIHENKIYPFLFKLLPYMFRRLNLKWELFKQIRHVTTNESTTNDNEQMEKETLEEEICRHVSKEFIDILHCILIEKPPSFNVNEEDAFNYANKIKKSEEERLSGLGKVIITKIPDVIYITATLTTWLDSSISLKATELSIKLVDKLIEENIIKYSSEVGYLFNQILIALGYFGEYENNQSLLLTLFIKLYEGYIVKAGFHDLKQKLVEFCGGNVRNWTAFQEKWLKNPNIPIKKKRDSLKKLLNQVIGKNLAELHKRNKEEVKNLHAILVNKPNKDILEEDDYNLWKLF